MQPEALPDAARPRELRGLATALYVLLSAQALACAVKIAITYRLYVLVERVRADEDVSGFDIQSAVDFADYVDWLQAVLFVTTAVTWIRWLLRARANVDAWGATNQRFGPGWVVGGWFVPVANLVLPAIVTYDVSAGPGAPGRDRDRQPLAVAWGVVFGAAVVLWCAARILEPGLPSGVPSDAEVLALLRDASSYEILVVVTQGYALLAIGVAIALVSSVTRRQTARLERRDLSPAG